MLETFGVLVMSIKETFGDIVLSMKETFEVLVLSIRETSDLVRLVYTHRLYILNESFTLSGQLIALFFRL